MRNLLAVLSIAALLALPVAARAADQYKIDTVHSSLVFAVNRGGLVDVYGSLNITEGSITLDTANLANSAVSLTVDMNSVDTNNDKRDEHVRSADFYNVAAFPNSTFQSTGLSDNGDGTWNLTGDLEFMGIRKPVTIPISMKGPETGEKGTSAGFFGEFILNTADFGWPAGGLGNEVKVIVSLLANKMEPTAAAAH
ncbi:YceI family protein [bacterium]|nr:YceI family protein [bacterium]